MNLFELFVKIGVDDQASGKLKDISGKLGKGLATAAKVGVAAVGTITTASAAMTTAFAKGSSEVAQYGDNIDKMSQKMGLSAQAYQEWDFIMQHSMESLKAGMKTLANAVDSGNDAFERLGISQKEIATMSQEDLFAKTIEQLQKVENETERTFLAGQLLGRGATELGALLNTSAEDTEAMRKQVHELGGVMSDKAVKAAAAFQDSLQNMQTAFSGIQRGMLSEFLPSMVSVMDGLSLIFSGNDSGIGKVTDGVNQFADKLMEAVPKIFELGEGILTSLATAILDNLPTLTNTATKVIMKLFSGIVSALPTIAKGAVEIIKSLTKGLSDGLPTIMKSAVELINTLASGIITMLPDIIKLGLDLIVALANGLTKFLPKLIPTVVSVVLEIVDTLTNPEQLSMLINSAMALIVALVSGLLNPDSLSKLMNAAITLIMNLVNYLLDSENVSKLIKSAISIVAALVKGIISARLELANAALTLISELKNKFINTDWASLGRNVINGILSGLKSAWSGLWSWFSNGVSSLISGAKEKLGIHSPSKVFSEIGKNMALSLGEGWANNINKVGKKINGTIDFSSKSSFSLKSQSVSPDKNTSGVQIVQNIYAQKQSAAELMQEARWQARMGVTAVV